MQEKSLCNTSGKDTIYKRNSSDTCVSVNDLNFPIEISSVSTVDNSVAELMRWDRSLIVFIPGSPGPFINSSSLHYAERVGKCVKWICESKIFFSSSKLFNSFSATRLEKTFRNNIMGTDSGWVLRNTTASSLSLQFSKMRTTNRFDSFHWSTSNWLFLRA